MSINATLIGQMIWFAIFIWITMKYVWPPLQKAMADRQ
ncbi:MAG: F0F1 ATP synthase subunit B, partial [Rhodocyclaceae bacterium]|nr:F0F1 ATP synthase subunit B [Rhodocyclaceae bacterium]MBL8489706.1 F0F1 ATP synthase subunit B [Rhodocyclaceae bacterium]